MGSVMAINYNTWGSSWGASSAWGVSWGVAPVVVSGGGGGYPNRHPLPQYYSRRVLDERVSLPQEPTSNRVAIDVLDDAKELEARLAHDDRHFTDMLEQTQHMLKQTATYIESQQIYNIVRAIEAKIQARRDAELAERMKPIIEKLDDAEFQELMELI